MCTSFTCHITCLSAIKNPYKENSYIVILCYLLLIFNMAHNQHIPRTTSVDTKIKSVTTLSHSKSAPAPVLHDNPEVDDKPDVLLTPADTSKQVLPTKAVAIQLKCPSISILAGCTASGKTYFTRQLLYNLSAVYAKPIKNIVYCYLIYQDMFDEIKSKIPNIQFHKGIPTSDFFDKLSQDDPTAFSLVLLDDLQSSIMDDKNILNLLTVRSHHQKINVIIILQNLYSQGRFSKTLSLQSQYLFTFKSLRDTSSLGILSRQVFGKGQQNFIPDVMAYISRDNAYPYLCIDLTPEMEMGLRLRTCILPGETMRIFQAL